MAEAENKYTKFIIAAEWGVGDGLENMCIFEVVKRNTQKIICHHQKNTEKLPPKCHRESYW